MIFMKYVKPNIDNDIQIKGSFSLYTKALCIYLICLPLGAMNLSGTLGSLLKYIALLPILVWILNTKKSIKIPKYFIGQFLWVFWICLSAIWSINSSTSIGRAITNLMFLLLFLSAISNKWTVNDIFLIKKTLVWSSRITAIITLIFSSYVEGRLYLSGRIAEDPNYLCAYFLFGIVYVIECLLYKKNTLPKVFAYIIELLLYLYIILYTGSRGGLLSIATAAVIIFLFNKQKKASIKKILLIVAVYSAILLVITFIPESVAMRFSLTAIAESNGTGRFEIWKHAIDVFEESNVLRQLIGYGTATIRNVFMVFGYPGKVAHNIFIEVLLENGLLGLIIYTFVILRYIITAFKIKDFFAVAIMVGIAVLSLSTSLYAFKPYWNIMIYIGCLYRCQTDKNVTPQLLDNVRIC